MTKLQIIQIMNYSCFLFRRGSAAICGRSEHKRLQHVDVLPGCAERTGLRADQHDARLAGHAVLGNPEQREADPGVQRGDADSLWTYLESRSAGETTHPDFRHK